MPWVSLLTVARLYPACHRQFISPGLRRLTRRSCHAPDGTPLPSDVPLGPAQKENPLQNITLNESVQMPTPGFGVYEIPPEQTEQAVTDALAVGYRDTALHRARQRAGEWRSPWPTT